MKDKFDILNRHEYHVNKGFHRQVNGPLNYFIKIVGIDCDKMKVCDAKKNSCKANGAIKPNEKYSSVVVMFFLLRILRRKRIRNEPKKKRYEELEEAV